MRYKAGSYDIVVIGAGHAGCEAGLAGARMGCKTLLITLSLDNVALMPCNPAVGGPAKGHLVREVDALGGEIGINTDKTLIQMRLLNTGKGPAVHALRAQTDKRVYQMEMTKTIESQEKLTVKQGMVEEVLVDEKGVAGVVTQTGAVFRCRAVVIATGTYLKGRIIIGNIMYDGGPNGQFPSIGLAASLKSLGLNLFRFKTGTPPRVDRRTVDFSRMTIQPGDPNPLPFSFMTDRLERPHVPCWLTYTNERTHTVIKENLHRSPLYSGLIEGVGPRYCPSIEDKIVRFGDKEAHQIFVEPEGLLTYEMYVQGMSTSLPEDVQLQMLRTIKGMENVEIMRPGYAIEYEVVDATQLKPSLETKVCPGLFTAGQLNGTSGYEEAAAQGIIAGINAARYCQGQDPVILKRSEAYIGVLIDDLVTKGTREPYRMMTSRAEYRLLLRQDNADLRLTALGHRIGLASEARYQRLIAKKERIKQELERLQKTVVSPTDELAIMVLEKKGSSQLKGPANLGDLLRRPELSYEDIARISPSTEPLPREVEAQVEIQLKYEGYITRQLAQVERFEKIEERALPQDIDYGQIRGLSKEAQQKLAAIRPVSVGQAGRISGVSPADVNVLLIYLEQRRRERG
ncbi:MAG: tRNA uridine-5-carboxymethylaminomethyl(34) synthesis enzyme MnmG [Bacillota bacterium]